MNEKQEVTPRKRTARTGNEPERVLRPPVDIFEDSNGISLHADKPGVPRESLEIRVDSDTLTIEGDTAIGIPDGIQPLHADIPSTRYRREFSLSSELDSENIEATLKDGVLTLRIHKRAEVRPRRIEVHTG